MIDESKERLRKAEVKTFEKKAGELEGFTFAAGLSLRSGLI